MQKLNKTIKCCPRSSKIFAFGANWQCVNDFVLVINSNIGPIWHLFYDMTTYWLIITNFFCPSYSALCLEWPISYLWKSFTNLLFL